MMTKNSHVIIPKFVLKSFAHNTVEWQKVFLYSFEDKIPVGIWDGKCVVDFNEIYQYFEFLPVQPHCVQVPAN